MRIIIYTNILSPYRKYFFDIFNKICEKKNIFFKVLIMANTEPNRNWKYDDYKTDYTILLKSKTYSIKDIYIHYNPDLKEIVKKLEPTHIVCAGSYLCPGINTILKLKNKLNYETYFWSESHLNEERNYSIIKLILRELVRRRVYSRFDAFWFAGRLSLDFINKYATKNSKKLFVPNMVDSTIFDYHQFIYKEKESLKRKYNLNTNNVIFVCPARLTSAKGIDRFLDFIKEYHNKKKVTIAILGDGELKEEIQNKILDYGIDGRLLGYFNQKTTAELYAISDVFLMPSISDPNPLTCIEALWEGLPLFVSNHVGNYPEIVQEGINGFVFNYYNKEELYKKLDRLLKWSESDYKRAKDYSYNLAKNNYLTEVVVNRVCNEMKNKF